MAQFFWNFTNPSGDNRKAYEAYLQNSAYLNDIKDCITYNSNGIKTLLLQNDETSKKVNSGIISICGKLDTGFEMLGHHLAEIDSGIKNISSEISSLSSLLDWKLSALIEEQRITNNLLGNITNLLKIPDIQKERAYYIEEGLKYLKNALIEGWNSDFFDDAFSAFNEALIREPKDYISLSKIGFIQLFSIRYLDFAKAESNLRKSFRYANAEATVGGTNFTNNLNPKISDFKIDNNNIHIVTSVESMLYCARACALQNNFNDAIQLTADAFKKVPTLLNAAYDCAKYMCVICDFEKALPLIVKLIEIDKFQTIKIIGDPDLICKKEVSNLLEELARKKREELEELLKYCEEHKFNDQQICKVIDEVKIELSYNSYLHSCKGLEMINKKRFWTLNNVDYSIEIERHIKLKNLSVNTFENYLDYILTFNLLKNADLIPVTVQKVDFHGLTILEYITKSELYTLKKIEIVQRCISYLESQLDRKYIFGIKKFGKEERLNGIWLIDYLKKI